MVTEAESAAVIVLARLRQRTTDRIIQLFIAHFLRLQNGRIVELREFMDSFDAVQQVLGREIFAVKPDSGAARRRRHRPQRLLRIEEPIQRVIVTCGSMKPGFEEAQTPYSSGSQSARLWTERWVKDSVYCPNCGNPKISQFPANRPVAEFFLPVLFGRVRT